MVEILVDGISKEKGGIGSFLYNMARWSKLSSEKPKIEFTFLAPEGSEYKQLLKEINCEVYEAPRLSKKNLYLKTINKICEQKHFDYVWINNTSKVNKSLLRIAKKNKIKIITHPHGIDNEEKGLKKTLFHLIDKINQNYYFKSLCVPLACSKEAANNYYEKSPDILSKTVVINNGIFIDDFLFSPTVRTKIREKYNLTDKEVLIGTAGRMSPVKNHQFLVKLISKLEDNFKLMILGDGEEREQIEKLINVYGVEKRVILTGKVNNVRDFLSAFDLFVLPSLNEGMPYSVIEAQTEGLQCVVSDTIPNEVKITNLVSFAKLNDVDDWADKIKENFRRIDSIQRDKYSEVISRSGYSIESSFSCFRSALNIGK